MASSIVPARIDIELGAIRGQLQSVMSLITVCADALERYEAQLGTDDEECNLPEVVRVLKYLAASIVSKEIDSIGEVIARVSTAVEAVRHE